MTDHEEVARYLPRQCCFCWRPATADGDGIYCSQCVAWHITDERACAVGAAAGEGEGSVTYYKSAACWAAAPTRKNGPPSDSLQAAQ